MPRRPKPAPITSPWRSYLRARLGVANLLDPREAAQYRDPALPTNLLAAYAVGAAEEPSARILSEVELGAKLAALLAPTTPPAADPLAVALCTAVSALEALDAMADHMPVGMRAALYCRGGVLYEALTALIHQRDLLVDPPPVSPTSAVIDPGPGPNLLAGSASEHGLGKPQGGA